jgi:hypothetical protein
MSARLLQQALLSAALLAVGCNADYILYRSYLGSTCAGLEISESATNAGTEYLALLRLISLIDA